MDKPKDTGEQNKAPGKTIKVQKSSTQNPKREKAKTEAIIRTQEGKNNLLN